MSTTYFTAGAPYIPGTTMLSNVTGECGHRHRTADTAAECIDRETRRLKASPGNQHAYLDRCVMVEHAGDEPRHPVGRDCPICGTEA